MAKRSSSQFRSGLLLGSAAAFLAAAACAPVAIAAPLRFNGMMTFQVGSVGPIEIAGSGEVGVTGLPANPRVALPVAAFAGQVVMPINDPNVFPIAAIVVEGSNQAATLERAAPGEPIGGSMPLAGVAKVCLYATCDANPLTNLSIPLSVVGRHATAYATGPVNLTVIGAPWTTGEVANTSPGSVQAGADHISLNVVTPIFISSNLGAYPQIPAHARLTLVAGADCDNGLDDDGDLLVDHPADEGCASRDDISEGLGYVEACRNGLDDDGDGLTDFGADPGCPALRAISERNSTLPCDNNLDDDHDGLKDNLDPGCASPTDLDEADLGDGVCNDGQDQDFDGLADFPLDPGCASADDTDERGDLACDDLLDADGDGRAAYPADPGCVGPSDTNERHFNLGCDDGLDNDGNGAVDHPADISCQQPIAGFYEGVGPPACANGIDDDEDGAVDTADTGCESANDSIEDIVLEGVVVLDEGNTLPDESALSVGSATWVEVRQGGLVGHRFWLTNGGLSVAGGTIGGDLRMLGGGSMSSGSIGGTLRLYGSVAFFQVAGGTIGGIEAADRSRVRIRVTDTGGRALGAVGESAGTLAVTLADGTVSSIPFLREPTATIELVPEPAPALAALAAMAGLAALARRRVPT